MMLFLNVIFCDFSHTLQVETLNYYKWLVEVRCRYNDKMDMACFQCPFKAKNFKVLFGHMTKAHQMSQDGRDLLPVRLCEGGSS